MKNDKRKTVIVDQELQHGLSRRLMTYWAGTWFLVFALPIMVRLLTDPMPFGHLAQQIVQDFWFPMLVSIFLLPVVIWDAVRFSNRCAGPVYRIGRTIREMAEGKPVREIRLRQNDFCGQLAESVNYLIESRTDQTEPAVDEDALETVV